MLTRVARVVGVATLTAAVAACGNQIEVRTMAAPEASFAALHTFRMLPGPARRDGRVPTGADDPMINNSIANRAIRDQIQKAFQDRGYGFNDMNPDFAVAFYATAKDKLDVNVWDYGYPFWPRWPRYVGPRTTVTQYTEGSVIVDVVKADTRELLWRGEGKAELSDDPVENVKQLSKAAVKIVEQFPKASARVVASRP